MQSIEIQSFLAALPMPALVVDGGGRVVAANGLVDVLFGPDIVGRPVAQSLRQPSFLAAFGQVTQSRLPQVADLTVTSPGGLDTAYQATLSWLDARAGAAILVTLSDQSEQIATHEIRREFVANVSHELRTPLTAIIGFIETLAGPAQADAAARTRFLDVMRNEADRMARLIDDLLSLSRVEDNERRRPRDHVDLSAEVRGACAILSGAASRANVTLTISTPPEPVLILGDAEQIRQLALNLIENAIKYGGGRVDITVHSDTGPDPQAILSVRDHGDGIAAHHIPRLTERFYRVDAHRSRAIGGTGLGLAIVKHITNRHRGRLRIDSQLGQGTTICVTIPSV